MLETQRLKLWEADKILENIMTCLYASIVLGHQVSKHISFLCLHTQKKLFCVFSLPYPKFNFFAPVTLANEMILAFILTSDWSFRAIVNLVICCEHHPSKGNSVAFYTIDHPIQLFQFV